MYMCAKAKAGLDINSLGNGTCIHTVIMKQETTVTHAQLNSAPQASSLCHSVTPGDPLESGDGGLEAHEVGIYLRWKENIPMVAGARPATTSGFPADPVACIQADQSDSREM